MRNVLIEISALDSTSENIVILRGCAAHAGPEGSYLDGKEWLPVIVGGPTVELGYWNNNQPAALNISYGSVSILLSAETGSNVWPIYSFDGADATIWVGEMGAPFTAYRKIFTGKLGPIDRTSGQTANLPLLGPEAVLNKPVLSDTYGGTGGADGPTDLMGTWKPYAIGACTNVAPVLIDPIKWIYQVDAYDACATNTVYEAAYPLDPSVAIVSTYAELAALTIPDGKWAAAPNVGMFRLANEPTGKITADIGTPATVGEVSSALMLRAGISSARIDASVGNTGRAYSLYVTEQTQIIDLVRDAAFAGGRYVIANGEGKFFFAPLFSTKAAGWLSSERNALPLVIPDKITQEPPVSPTHKVRIGHTRVWSKHSSNEISPALKQLAANQAALDAKAQAARDAAEDAKAQAELALERYNAIVADDKLSRDEKRAIIERFEGYTAERPGIIAEAINQGITTEKTAYQSAYDTLAAYLESLSPAYYDTSADTPIVPADFKDAFISYDVAKERLRNAIANKSAKTANWNTVTGDGKPADNATVGAPKGTEVGGRPAETVIEDIDRANNTIAGVHKQLPNLVLPLLQKPIDELSALNIRYGASQLKATTALHRESLAAIRKLTTRLDEDGSKVAEDYLQLTSRVTDAEKAIKGIDVSGPIEAGLAEIRKTIANANYATSEAIDLKIANYGKNVSAWQTEEERVRSEKDSALAEDIEAMGVSIRKDVGDSYTTLEGAFNDLRKLVVDSDGNDALALRIDEMGVRITTEVGGEKTAREAAIRSVEKAIIDGDKVSADRLDTLSSSVDGVIGPQGEIVKINGIIQTLQKTQADDNGARATETKNLQSRLDNVNGASLEQTLTTFANKVDGVGASYVLKVQTDQNGQRYIAGMGVAIENGVSAIAFSADSFRLTTPGITPQQVFYADATGIYAPNLTVEKLKANSIDSVSLKQAASSKTSYSIVENDVACGRGVTTTVVSYQFYKEDDDSLLKVQMFAQCYNQDDLDFFGDIVLDGSSRQRAQVRMPFDNSNSRGQAPITPFAFLPNVPKGNHTIAFTLFSNETEGPTYVRAGSTLEVTELRRASIGSSTGSAPPVSGDSSGGGGSGGGSGDGGYGGGGTYQPELSQT